MTTKVYVAFYDLEAGMDRENWNTFYTPYVIALDEKSAHAKAMVNIREQAIDYHGPGASDAEIEKEISRYDIYISESEIDL